MTYKSHENGKMLSRNFIKTYLDMSTEECRVMRNLGIMINWNSKLTEIKIWLFLWLEDGFWLALATIMLTDFFRHLAIQQISVSRAYLLLLSMSEWVDLPWFLEEIEVIVLSHCNWTHLLHTACNIIQENTIYKHFPINVAHLLKMH